MLNRLVTQIVPQRDYTRRRCQGFPVGMITNPGNSTGCLVLFPMFPNLNGTDLRIAADTSDFGYDLGGQMVRADNRYARVHRTYSLSGLLEVDSTIIGDYTTPTTDRHFNAQTFTYDLNGRRLTSVLEPWQNGGTGYAYTAFGALEQVTDPFGNRYRLTYDLASRPESLLVYGAGASTPGVRERRSYDAGDRLVSRNRVSAAFPGSLNLDSLFYDRRDKVVRARTLSRARGDELTTVAYDGLGAVMANERTRDVGGYQIEEFRSDGYANTVYSVERSSGGGNAAPLVSTYFPSGFLSGRVAILSATPPQNHTNDELTQLDQNVGQVTLLSDLKFKPQFNGGGW